MAKAGRAEPALPKKSEVAGWRAALVSQAEAQKFLRQRGVSEACQQEFEFGFDGGKVVLPIYGEPVDGQHDLLAVKSFEVGHEEAGKIPGGNKRHVFPWPMLDSWDLDNPVVIVSDEVSVAALTSIGQNAICTTAGTSKQSFEDLPVARLKPAGHFMAGANLF